jgi:hypothetical protein
MLIRGLVVLLSLAWPSLAEAQPRGPCRPAITAAERALNVPDRLMQAVAIMESGRRDPSGSIAAWPWTINVEGVGEMFETKAQAIAAVNAHRARGARSIDVGCMQINLKHHPNAFASLEEAFDPDANTRYAAQFLQQLLAQTGSWPLAVAGYHSLTPDIGGDYAKKVLAIWARPERANTMPDVGRALARSPSSPPSSPPLSSPPSSAPVMASSTPSLPSSLAPVARLLPPPGGAGPQLTGRGLDSYRAMPTRLATISLFRRS